MNYSQGEMVDMIFILGECQRNTLLASRVYKARYPERRHPQPKCLSKILERFTETGNVLYQKRSRTKRTVNENNLL